MYYSSKNVTNVTNVTTFLVFFKKKCFLALLGLKRYVIKIG